MKTRKPRKCFAVEMQDGHIFEIFQTLKEAWECMKDNKEEEPEWAKGQRIVRFVEMIK